MGPKLQFTRGQPPDSTDNQLERVQLYASKLFRVLEPFITFSPSDEFMKRFQ
jgi:hypothetical protein